MRLRLLAGNNAIDPLSLLCLKAVGILFMKENDGVGGSSLNFMFFWEFVFPREAFPGDRSLPVFPQI